MTLFVSAALLGACGGSSNPGGGASCATAATVSIAAAGVSPMNVCVVPGGSVTFANGDTVSHTVTITGTSCPASPGPVGPSASATATFPTATTCQFSAGTTAAFQGNIAVTAGPPPPGH